VTDRLRAVQISEYGGPEVMRCVDLPLPALEAGEALVQLEASGVNYGDIYNRQGVYPLKSLPSTLGKEGAGVVTATHPDVRGVRVGDRVALGGGYLGGYATSMRIPADRLVIVPPSVSLRDAAAVMVQGMTAHYLVTSTYPVSRGSTCLVHAAAGGVGLLLCQMIAARDGRTIATVSSDEKAELARRAGASDVIVYGRDDFAERTRELTGGRGVDVVFDGVGATTFAGGLACLRARGMMVLFGQASGPVAPIDPQILNKHGAVFLTRPTLSYYTATHDELAWRAGELFAWISTGRLQVRIDSAFPLVRAADAHRALESRRTAGKILLTPT
jgi:NADPH2:quinone reductase